MHKDCLKSQVSRSGNGSLGGLVLAALLLVLPSLGLAGGPLRVLSVSETPESNSINYYNADGAYMFFTNYFLSPRTMLSDAFDVTQRRWQRDAEPLAGLDEVDALVLWECPRAVEDEREEDPYYSDLEVVTPERMAQIERLLKGGGGLVVAGGALCYGDGAELLGSTDDRKGEFRKYLGFDGTALEALLPVEIPAGVTLAELPNEAGNLVATRPEDPMLAGLDVSSWVVGAYHKVSARPGAEVLAETAGGDPLVLRWQVGEGRVVCVTAAPRAAGLLRSAHAAKSPVWEDEARFWDRCLRWACGVEYDAEADVGLKDRVSELTGPTDRAPLELARREYPYGADVRHSSTPTHIRSLALRYFAELGMNHVVTAGVMTLGENDGTGSSASPEVAERMMGGFQGALEEHGMYMFLKPEPHQGPRINDVPAEEWAQVVLPSGSYATNYGLPRPCPYSPSVLKHSADQIRGFARLARPFDRVVGAYCDDEWTWVLGYRSAYEGDPGIGCYSPWVNAIFKARTGPDAPPPVYSEPGYVASEGDAWLRWCEEIRQDPAAQYNAALIEAARGENEDFLISNYPGGFDGEADIMLEEIYLDCWRESELETFERIDVRTNFRLDHDRSGTPIHALMGIFRMPESKSVYPETLRLTFGACLGAAADGIILWNGENIWSPWMQHEGREDLAAEAARLGDFVRRYGAMFQQLHKPESDVWMLSHWFWINSFDNYYHCYPEEIENKERTWRMFQVSDIAVPALLRAGVAAEFVTEKQLLSERLFSRKAVLVPSLQYCRQGVVEQLEEYVRRGGKVFVDEATAVQIAGARTLPFDFSAWHRDISAGLRPTVEPCEENYRKQRGMREAYIEQAIPVLREHVTPVAETRVHLDDPMAAHRLLANGGTEYLFVYNADVDAGHRFEVGLADAPSVVYDVAVGEALSVESSGDGSVSLELDLEAGGWKVLALAPAEIGSLRAQALEAVGGRLRGELEVLDLDGERFEGAVPLEIVVHGESGSQTLYCATDEGLAQLDLPLTVAEAHSVELRDLMSGRRARVELGLR